MRNFIRWAVCGVLLAGCTSTQEVQSMRITDDTALVSLVGRRGDDQDKLSHALMAGAAKVTRERGYSYFVILDSAEANQVVERYIPGEIFSVPTSGRRRDGSQIQSYYYVTPARTVKELRPGLDIAIRMYREGDIDATQAGVWMAN